jgi:exopolysaccharide biosynthesis polyprenyl glycosylphosphotransferase
VASIIHALPSGPEDRSGDSQGEGVAALDTGDEVGASGADEGRSGGSTQRDTLLTPAAGPRAPGRRSLRNQLVIGDAIATTVVWLSVAIFGFQAGSSRQLVSAAAAIVVTLAALRRAGLYQTYVCMLPSRHLARVIGSVTIGALVFFSCCWLAGSPAGWAAVAGAAMSALTILTLRWRFGRWLKGQRSSGQHLRQTLLVGTNDDAIGLWSMLRDEPELGYRIVGVAGEDRPETPWGESPRCADVGECSSLARSTGANGIIVTAGAFDATTTAAIVRQAQNDGLHVQVWPGFMGLSSRRVRFAPVSGIPVFYVERPGAPTWQKVAKRAIDIGVTIAISPLVLPVLLLTAVCIKLEDGGPVLYHHAVIGRYGKPTTVLKLRTMVPNAAQMLADVEAMNERTGGPLFKATHDPRVTRIGRLLRATSVDELPQLWNVLTGTMSLVGPRFALPHEDAHFDADLRRRREMRPGITGLWQTEARDNPSFSAYRRLDLFYVDNWSLGLDLEILANTAHAVTVRAWKAITPARARWANEPKANELAVASLTVPELASAEPVSSE